jgi:hypothetical protein
VDGIVTFSTDIKNVRIFIYQKELLKYVTSMIILGFIVGTTSLNYPVNCIRRISLILSFYKIMTKSINLGDIALYKWKKGDPLYPSWYDEKDVVKLDPAEIILHPNTKYKLTISYPLSSDFILKITLTDKGISREDFIDLVIFCYKQIYKDEDDTSEIEASHIPGTFNRTITSGDYGIWGHDLSDLALHTLHIDGSDLSLGIDS